MEVETNVKLLATGQLATLDNLIDTTTGTLKLRALFANPDETLYPNEFVNIRLLVNTMTERRPGAGAGGSARRAGHLRLCDQRQQHRLGAPGEGWADRRRL